MLESDGKLLLTHRKFNVNMDSLAELLSTDWAMPGLGDAGAHVSQVMDAGWATFVLSHWHRKVGLYSLEEAVRRLAAVPAEVLGLNDRGVLAVGKRADINVIEIDWRSASHRSSMTSFMTEPVSFSEPWAIRRPFVMVR